MYNSIEVTKLLRAKVAEYPTFTGITKTQKLLYIMYGLWLVKKDEPLFRDQPKAWPLGPVFPRTGSDKTKFLYEKKIQLSDIKDPNMLNDASLNALIDQVLQKYGNFSATELVEWSHEKNSPWERTKRQAEFGWNTDIPDEYTKEYFNQYKDDYDF